jgi:hypothetical protein
MKDLFDSTTAQDIRQRIMRLHPGSERQWGDMTVAQTLAHCTSGMQMAMGIINPKRAPSRQRPRPDYQAAGLWQRQTDASQLSILTRTFHSGPGKMRLRARAHPAARNDR